MEIRRACAAGLSTMRVRSNVIRERAHAFYVRHGYALSKRQAVLDKDLAPAVRDRRPRTPP